MAQNDQMAKTFAEAEKSSVMPGGGVVPLRMPAGALNYLDRNQYISNMEVVAYFPGVNLMIFGDEHSCLWAKGKRRMIAFQGGWLDITEPTKATVVKESGLGVFQSCVYNKQLKKWLRVVSHQMPLTPGTREYPRGKYHEEYAKKSIDDSGFRGIKTYDVTNPEKTELLNEFETGKTGFGVHCPFYDGGQYGYLAAGWDDQLRMESTERVYSNGLMIVDMSDPAKVKEVSRWWVPGQRLDEEELYRTTYPFAGDQCSWTGNRTPCIVPVRVEDGGKVGYGGWGHFGMYVHDLTDIRNPKVFGKVTHPLEPIGGIPYHHVVPVNAGPARIRGFRISSSPFPSAWNPTAASRGTRATSSTSRTRPSRASSVCSRARCRIPMRPTRILQWRADASARASRSTGSLPARRARKSSRCPISTPACACSTFRTRPSRRKWRTSFRPATARWKTI